jgi:hypothetical protein
MRLSALRGATTADRDTSDAIRSATAELLHALLERNGLVADDIVSIVFTATPDLRADFPAVAAREMGLASIPLLCCQEIGSKRRQRGASASWCTAICRGSPARTTCTCVVRAVCASICRSEPMSPGTQREVDFFLDRQTPPVRAALPASERGVQ